jgi:hypothetical protein
MNYVHHGALNVPRSIDKQYRAAKAYLSRDPVEAKLFRRLEHPADGRHFRLSANSHNDDSFNPNSNTIDWDPYSALRTTTGGRQSPALGLGHEVDHATEDPKVGQHLMRVRDTRYDTAEERRVIAGSETHAARTLGESVRHDHNGSTYRVATPVVCGFIA